MSDESPPPYSAVIASKPLIELPTDTTLPFSQSGQLATKILALVSEGKTLDSRFRDVREVSAGANFDSQTAAVILCERFEKLIWESRNIAGIALVAIKDFNEVVLDFLSEPDVAVQDRLKELTSASQLLRKERDSAAKQKTLLDVLLKDLDDFHRTIHPPPTRKRQRRKALSGKMQAKGTPSSRKSEPPLIVAPAEPVNSLLTVSASLGLSSRSCTDYTSHLERAIDMTILSWFGVEPQLEYPVPGPASVAPSSSPPLSSHLPQNPRLAEPVRKRPLDCAPVEHAEPTSLSGLVHTLVQDLRGFTSRVEVFGDVFTELVREQDIFIVYLKDGQSVRNLGYSTEVNRVRRQLPCLCNALDAYSKGKLT